MKKKCAILIICILLLSGCGNENSTEQNDANTENEKLNTQMEQVENNSVEEDTDIDTEINTQLTDEEIDAAKQAALAYYKNTVFEVNSIEYLDAKDISVSEYDCCFSVNVSKDGVVQEPNRSIYLYLDENSNWNVVTEGY